MTNDLFTEKAAALRDFFASVNAEELAASADAVAREFGLPLNPDTDWTEVEYDFNRLFVGPAAVPAPPYASAYLEEPTLMGSPALKVREAYRTLGLQVPDQGSTPDDHIAFELDALTAAGANAGNATGLVRDHMGDWVPKFTAAVKTQSDVSEPIDMVVGALDSWLEAALAETAETTA